MSQQISEREGGADLGIGEQGGEVDKEQVVRHPVQLDHQKDPQNLRLVVLERGPCIQEENRRAPNGLMHRDDAP